VTAFVVACLGTALSLVLYAVTRALVAVVQALQTIADELVLIRKEYRREVDRNFEKDNA
jgi:hypothetical protein